MDGNHEHSLRTAAVSMRVMDIVSTWVMGWGKAWAEQAIVGAIRQQDDFSAV